MTGCPEWKDAIAGWALGDAAEPGLTAHVEVCPGCADALRESRLAAGHMDEALRRLAAVEPPVYGPERVMARAGERHRASGWWKWAAVGCVAAMLIAALLWMRRPPHPVDVAGLTSWHSPTDSLLRPPVSAAWNAMPRLGERFFADIP